MLTMVVGVKNENYSISGSADAAVYAAECVAVVVAVAVAAHTGETASAAAV